METFQGRKDVFLKDVIPNLKEIWSEKNSISYNKVRIFSEKKFIFICDVCGKEYETTPQLLRERKEKGRIGCKHCYGGYHPPKKGESFAEVRPDLLKWFNYEKNFPFRPEYLKSKSNKDFYWKCEKCGYEWKSSFNTMVSRKPYCSKCSLYKHYEVEKTVGTWLEENNLELVDESIPLDRTVLQDIRVDLRCKSCKGVFNRNLLDVSRKNIKVLCPYCAGRELLTGFNDVITYCNKNNISLEDYRDEIDLSKKLPNSDKVVKWWCENHQGVFNQSIKNHILEKRSCNICNGSILVKGINDFKTMCLKRNKGYLLDEWCDERNPEDFSPNTNTVVKWKCNKGHIYESQISARYTGNNCPICSGYQIVRGINDFESQNPELMKDWDWDKNEIKPYEIGKGSAYRAHWKCHKCGYEWTSLVSDRNYFYKMSKISNVSPNGCPNCAINNKKSFLELKLYEKIKEYVPDLISGYIFNEDGFTWSVDMYSPSKKIAVEFNGVYWHSEKYVGKYRHYNKMKDLESIGVDLYQVWKDDFIEKDEIVVRSILSKFGVLHQEKMNARNSEIRDISYAESKEFLDKYHIQGSVTGNRYVGGFINKILVGVLVLEDAKLKSGNFKVIKRYACSCNVRGLFSKMLSKIPLEEGYKFITYSDNCISKGKLYELNGFKLVKELEPSYWIDDGCGKRKHKFGYRKSFFRDNPDLIYKEGMTEFELEDVNKFRRVWDAGKKVWIRGY